MATCTICAYRTPKKYIQIVLLEDLAFGLHQNSNLLDETRSTTYNLQAYEGAILYPKGLHCKEKSGPLDMCKKCERALIAKKKKPKNSFANWHYMGVDELPADVKKPFSLVTTFNIMLVAHSGVTRTFSDGMQKKSYGQVCLEGHTIHKFLVVSVFL
jgi:hypothetical protein